MSQQQRLDVSFVTTFALAVVATFAFASVPFLKAPRQNELFVDVKKDDTMPALPFKHSSVILWINGERHEVKDNLAQPLARTTLLEYLREVGLKGTKFACGSGNCGACTVIVSRIEEDGAAPRHRTVNACLLPLLLVVGAHITTIEGVGDGSNPHLVQSRIAELNGSQCGFCTPGVVLSLYATLCQSQQEGHQPTPQDLEDSVAGNLCRCTGYSPILDAAKTLSCVQPVQNQNQEHLCGGGNARVTAEHCFEKCGDSAVDVEDCDATGLGSWARAIRAQATAGRWNLTATGDKIAHCVGVVALASGKSMTMVSLAGTITVSPGR